MSALLLTHGAVTDVGRVRAANEDAYAVQPPLFGVADGMGGHDGGDVASAITVEEIARLAREVGEVGEGAPRDVEEGDLVRLLARCQERILRYGAEQRAAGHRRFHAGTTVVTATVVTVAGEPTWLLMNLGDSRAYGVVEGALRQLTVDHSVVQELVDSGALAPEAVADHPERHVITRALGGPHAGNPDFFTVPVATCPRVMLCSDGVSGLLGPDEIERLLTTGDTAEQAAAALVAAALEAGGTDNATAVVVDARQR
ncbi:PP2C family protein-serine/threonine phosphatase [Nocardioides acrostichi]|uniref:Serine/threonine-protein phosphatase n=1 Tax=Nocardioides acrostichi TaxID=2784339 RepID=A0A930V360_9ACTN|nr:protein phosphatase 2C domain-containing protein [Nocardioides acrostichi]MBF4163021.1 serine/threonine-protein phosphatase [Nocardioides acrostichi]